MHFQRNKIRHIIIAIYLTLFVVFINKYLPENTLAQGSVVVQKNLLTPHYYNPLGMIIESIGLNLNIVEVGVTRGALDVPEAWDELGWYYRGAKAGEIGNVIIVGHYDDNFGNPAAFWKLKNISVNDKVTVLDDNGNSHVYIIREVFLVRKDAPNAYAIFEDIHNRATLTLITCGGIWIPGESNYSKRLIVRAELI